MPSRRAVQKKLRAPEWEVSSFMMDRALEAVVRQISKLDRDHDIPYLAGYSKNGKTIYIDRHMPKSFSFGRRRADSARGGGKTLMNHLGLRYLHGHPIATRAEQAAVRCGRNFLGRLRPVRSGHLIQNSPQPNIQSSGP